MIAQTKQLEIIIYQKYTALYVKKTAKYLSHQNVTLSIKIKEFSECIV